ncbi:MAG: hypothetical protein WBM17_05745 [Anaerolineales bacterium]
MRSWLIGIGVALVAGALGVGAAYGGSELVKTYRPELIQNVQSVRGADAREGGFWMMGSDDGSCDFAAPGGIRERMRDRMDRIRDRRQGQSDDANSELTVPEEILK